MKHLVPVQAWLPQEIAEQVKSHCQNHCQPVSEFIRTLVLEACATGLATNRIERHLEWISSDLNFAAVALDALLAGHADPDLRERVHEAFARKEERRRTTLQSVEGAVK
ncbi:MAG: hypothetical protein U9R07_11550 [Pseudomonadota bacterium]|jgi:hypothetical protein|uniref:hypothetical protein n=1 Tax=Novosphingobium sp. TaxID=1874826 RepID=UPI0025FEE523|nr:hypothetical protein [Novosphingobium sp.]MCC6925230.1 hypothetical protein [Novosphingobium sp.]MEA3264103.1 hypothetical protein [Pseudomonadota bacterium]